MSSEYGVTKQTRAAPGLGELPDEIRVYTNKAVYNQGDFRERWQYKALMGERATGYRMVATSHRGIQGGPLEGVPLRLSPA